MCICYTANSVLSHASLQQDFNHLDIHPNCPEKIVSCLRHSVLVHVYNSLTCTGRPDCINVICSYGGGGGERRDSVCERESVCVCVCVRERERERERN